MARRCWGSLLAVEGKSWALRRDRRMVAVGVTETINFVSARSKEVVGPVRVRVLREEVSPPWRVGRMRMEPVEVTESWRMKLEVVEEVGSTVREPERRTSEGELAKPG